MGTRPCFLSLYGSYGGPLIISLRIELHSGYFPIKEQKHRLYLTKANLLLTVHSLVLDTLKIKFFFQKNCVSKVNILFFADTV